MITIIIMQMMLLVTDDGERKSNMSLTLIQMVIAVRFQEELVQDVPGVPKARSQWGSCPLQRMLYISAWFILNNWKGKIHLPKTSCKKGLSISETQKGRHQHVPAGGFQRVPSTENEAHLTSARSQCTSWW